MYTLGINAAFHDPAACLVKDGILLSAAEDERFTHIKHGKRPFPYTTWELPFHAIDYCLKHAGISLADVHHVAYSFDPTPMQSASDWDALFLNSIRNAPDILLLNVPHHLQARFRGVSSGREPYQWHWVPHHLAHAASAFLCSPFPQAAILTVDGRGETASTSYAVGDGHRLDCLAQVYLPHSLGFLYENVTEYLGFLHSSDEYKVMALASFGKPRYLDELRGLVTLGANGEFTVGPLQLEERFGPARQRGGPLEPRHYDLAHSLQVVLEDTVLELVRWLHGRTKLDDLCMAGGVALNCVMNARLRDRGPFRNIWIQPAAGDAGTAIGAALFMDAQLRGAHERRSVMDHVFLGPEYSDPEIEEFLRWTKVPYRRLNDLANDVADLLVQDRVIGWFQGRMEMGPRALGARSILASPIHAEMQARLNEIKDREDFRPVAPVVMEEHAAEWFGAKGPSPFMLFVCNMPSDKADRIPAVRHTDGTARIQTINRAQNPNYYELIKAFYARTGVPVLVNTSFNTRGEPIVCTPRDAVECFWTSPLDALVIGSFLLEKPSTS